MRPGYVLCEQSDGEVVSSMEYMALGESREVEAGLHLTRQDENLHLERSPWGALTPISLPAPRFPFQVHCISTEFTPRKHGGEKGVPFRVQIDTFKQNENGEYTEHLHSASCQIKVFKVGQPHHAHLRPHAHRSTCAHPLWTVMPKHPHDSTWRPSKELGVP